jgi:carboxypeptidase-like protein
MRYFLLVVVCFTTFNLFAQERTYSGRVVGSDRKGVPFCIVQVKDRNEGVYCDENGNFSLSTSYDPSMTFIFYCIGFEKKFVPVSQLPSGPLTIELTKDVINLTQVEYHAKPGKVRHGVLGKEKLKHYGDCYEEYGDENVMFFRANPDEDGTLKEVYVFITNEGVPSSKFRIHVYEKNPKTNQPGKELTDSNLVVHANAGNEWVRADLGVKNIPINDGVFISVEWVSGHGNVVKSLQSAKHSEVTSHYGQVLGLSRNYGVSLMYHRRVFKGNWENIKEDYLCPMIYCTYTYVN